MVIVFFDDETTTPEKIVNALRKGRMPVKGKPVFIE